MPTYRVRWEIDIDADTPREAAITAMQTQRDPDSTATLFDVFTDSSDDLELEETVDLSKPVLEDYRDAALAWNGQRWRPDFVVENRNSETDTKPEYFWRDRNAHDTWNGPFDSELAAWQAICTLFDITPSTPSGVIYTE